MVGYLTTQAIQNPTAFMTLLGIVLPLQKAVNDEEAIDKIVVEFV